MILERSRDEWTFRWLETLLQDARLAGRSLWKDPGFSVVAFLILALGIGASTAVFSVVHTVVLKPLAFPEPDRIVALRSLWKATGSHGNVSLPDFDDWRTDSRSFEAMALYSDEAIRSLDLPVGLSRNSARHRHCLRAAGTSSRENRPDGRATRVA